LIDQDVRKAPIVLPPPFPARQSAAHAPLQCCCCCRCCRGLMLTGLRDLRS